MSSNELGGWGYIHFSLQRPSGNLIWQWDVPHVYPWTEGGGFPARILVTYFNNIYIYIYITHTHIYIYKYNIYI